MLIQPNGRAAVVSKDVTLTPQAVSTMIAFEELLTSLGLQFWMRCTTCMGGVHGSTESKGHVYVVECGCTTRKGVKW